MVFFNYINKSIKAYFFDNEALDYIDERINWKTAFFSVWGLNIIITTILSLISILLLKETIINPLFGFREEYVSVIETILLYPIGFFLVTGIIHLMLKLFGAKGTFTNTIKFALSIAIFPLIYFNTLLILFLLIPPFQEGLGFLYLISGLVFFFWSLAITFKVYAIIHDISQWRVFFAIILIPLLIGTILTFLSIFSVYQLGLNI